MSMMGCVATVKHFVNLLSTFDDPQVLTELFGIAFVNDSENVINRHLVVGLEDRRKTANASPRLHWPWEDSANALLGPQRWIELAMRQQTCFETAQEARHVTAFREVNWRSLNTIVTDEDDSAARLFGASVLMAMHIHDVIDADVQDVSPVETFINISRARRRRQRLIVVTVHELIGRPFDDERVDRLME